MGYLKDPSLVLYCFWFILMIYLTPQHHLLCYIIAMIIFFQIIKSMLIKLVKMISILMLSKLTGELWPCDTKVLKFGTSYQITIKSTKEILPCFRNTLNLICCLRCIVIYQVPICLKRYAFITLWLTLLCYQVLPLFYDVIYVIERSPFVVSYVVWYTKYQFVV